MTSSRSGPRAWASAAARSAWSLRLATSVSLSCASASFVRAVDLRFPLGVVGAGLRFALLGELLDRDDADHAALVYLLQALDLEDRVERLLPGHVAQGDRELALDVVARDDIPAAFRTENAEEVDDVGILELERDQLRPVRGGRSRRARRGRGRRGRRLGHDDGGKRGRAHRLAVAGDDAGTVVGAPASRRLASARLPSARSPWVRSRPSAHRTASPPPAFSEDPAGPAAGRFGAARSRPSPAPRARR